MKLAPFFTSLPSFITVCAALAQPAVNQPIPVRLLIKASGDVIFSGVVVTKGHDVTTKTGGTHKCGGTNNDAHRQPGATPTSALADAANRAGFTFDGCVVPFESEKVLIVSRFVDSGLKALKISSSLR